MDILKTDGRQVEAYAEKRTISQLKRFLDTKGNSGGLEAADLWRGLERQESFTLNWSWPKTGSEPGRVELQYSAVNQESSPGLLENLNLSKHSTSQGMQRRPPYTTQELRTIDTGALNVGVMTGRR